jgi:hypothetical protein
MIQIKGLSAYKSSPVYIIILLCALTINIRTPCVYQQQFVSTCCALRKIALEESAFGSNKTEETKLKEFATEWIHANKLYERYGFWHIFKDGRGGIPIIIYGHGVDSDIETWRVYIIPNKKRAISRDYGGYQTGIECFEGAYPLCRELRKRGYEARLEDIFISLTAVFDLIKRLSKIDEGAI